MLSKENEIKYCYMYHEERLQSAMRELKRASNLEYTNKESSSKEVIFN